MIALVKPASLLVHRKTADNMSSAEPTLVDWLLKKYPEIRNVGDDPAMRPGIVHRLDKETSGVMLVARNQASFEYMKSLFMKHDITKTYHAVVFGVPKKEEAVIDMPIGIRNGTLKRSVRSTKMQKEAVTAYRLIGRFHASDASAEEMPGTFSILEIRPKTGRTHQIRVHLAHIGHAVVGDPLYGPKKQPSWAHRLMLHAAAIEFTSRNGKHLKFEAEGEF